MKAGQLALGALGLFIVSMFLVWSNPDGVTRGPFFGDMTQPGMLILPALGYLGAVLGTVFGRNGMGRGMGITITILGVLNLAVLVGLFVVELGVGGMREGSWAMIIATVLLLVGGFKAIKNPETKKQSSQAQAQPA